MLVPMTSRLTDLSTSGELVIDTVPAPAPRHTSSGAHEPASIDGRGVSVEVPASDPAVVGLPFVGLVVVLVGSFLSQLDFFIVNVALPTIDRSLDASAPTLELVVAGYGIAYALLLVVGGRLGDTYGRRRLFSAGMAGFTLASLACGLAPTAPALVGARVAQGAAAAIMVPQVLSTIQATLTGERRAKAIGLYGAAAGIAVVAGQLLGGLLVSADLAGAGWRPIFLVNVPVGVAGLVLAPRVVPDTRSPNPAAIDRTGTVLLGLALGALLVPLLEGRSLGWPVWTWVVLGLAPVLATAFVVYERHAEQAGGHPLLAPSILRIRSLRTGLVMALPFFIGFGGFMFVYALTLQDGLGMGPVESGVALTPMAVGFFVASLASSGLVARFGTRTLTVGALIQGCGLLVLIATVRAGWPDLDPLRLLPGTLLLGLGQGMVASPLFRVILADVPPDVAGAGSGALLTTQQSALALGVATLGSLFLSLSHGGGVDVRDAFVTVLAIQTAIAVLVAGCSRRLPTPG